jgi:hypothetical protein
VVQGFKVVLDRFAADGDAVFDDLTRFRKASRINASLTIPSYRAVHGADRLYLHA